MDEQLEWLLAQSSSPENPVEYMAKAREWAITPAVSVEDVIAVIKNKTNNINRGVLSIAISASLDPADVFMLEMTGMSSTVLDVACKTLHIMVGFLVQEGYLTIARLPEIDPEPEPTPVAQEDWDTILREIGNSLTAKDEAEDGDIEDTLDS